MTCSALELAQRIRRWKANPTAQTMKLTHEDLGVVLAVMTDLEELREDFAQFRKRRLSRGIGDTVGEYLDNQAWIMFSHVAGRLNSGRDDLMEEWQDAWADGLVSKGYFSPHRGAAAWIARECNALIAQALSSAKLNRGDSSRDELAAKPLPLGEGKT